MSARIYPLLTMVTKRQRQSDLEMDLVMASFFANNIEHFTSSDGKSLMPYPYQAYKKEKHFRCIKHLNDSYELTNDLRRIFDSFQVVQLMSLQPSLESSSVQDKAIQHYKLYCRVRNYQVDQCRYCQKAISNTSKMEFARNSLIDK